MRVEMLLELSVSVHTHREREGESAHAHKHTKTTFTQDTKTNLPDTAADNFDHPHHQKERRVAHARGDVVGVEGERPHKPPSQVEHGGDNRL